MTIQTHSFDTLTVDYAGAGEKLHLVRNGKTLCGRTTGYMSYSAGTPRHTNCQRCIAKNDGTTTWPAMQAAMDEAAVKADADLAVAFAAYTEAKAAMEAAKAIMDYEAATMRPLQAAARHAHRVARNSQW